MVKGFKGFDKDLKCRGFQYEVGKTAEHGDGEVRICNSGLHFCEYPLDVFDYYPPAGSRFAEIEAEDVANQTDGDSKRVAKRLLIKAGISLKAMIEAAVKFTFDKAGMETVVERAKKATGAHAEEKEGVGSATGDQGAASATGYQGAASATGEEGCAVALGVEAKVMGAKGCWLTVAEWVEDPKTWKWHRVDVRTVKVDGKKIKADTWYQLVKGKFVEVA